MMWWCDKLYQATDPTEHQPSKYQLHCFPNDMKEGSEMSVLDGLGGMDTFASNGSMAFARFNCL